MASTTLKAFLASRERLVHTSRPLIATPMFHPDGSPRTNPDGTPMFENRPSPKGTGTTLDLGKKRAERRREARWDSQIRKAMGSAKAADRQFALHARG